jgi:probable addiction module antidote protein
MNKISKMLREIIEKKEGKSVKSVAKAIGIDHGSLYHSLREGGNPEANTILKILDHLGYDLKLIKRKEAKTGRPKPSKKGGRNEV